MSHALHLNDFVNLYVCVSVCMCGAQERTGKQGGARRGLCIRCVALNFLIKLWRDDL